MKKIIKILVVLVVAGFLILQFFRIDKTSQPIVKAETLESAVSVPADVQQIFGRACNDCHTNLTIYPWYSNVQPFAWMLKNHIDDGRRHLNFSTFNTNTPKRKAQKLEEICDEVSSKEMPLPSYLWIHRDAVLSDSDITTLCTWAKGEKDKIVVE